MQVFMIVHVTGDVIAGDKFGIQSTLASGQAAETQVRPSRHAFKARANNAYVDRARPDGDKLAM